MFWAVAGWFKWHILHQQEIRGGTSAVVACGGDVLHVVHDLGFDWSCIAVGAGFSLFDLAHLAYGAYGLPPGATQVIGLACRWACVCVHGFEKHAYQQLCLVAGPLEAVPSSAGRCIHQMHLPQRRSLQHC